KLHESVQVSGYKLFLAAFSNDYEVVTEIQQVLFNISGSEDFSQAGSNMGDAAAGFGSGNDKETSAEKKARKAKEDAAKSDNIGRIIIFPPPHEIIGFVQITRLT